MAEGVVTPERQAGRDEVIAEVRSALRTAQAEQGPRKGRCPCGRAALVSERSGRLTALGSVLAKLEQNYAFVDPS